MPLIKIFRNAPFLIPLMVSVGLAAPPANDDYGDASPILSVPALVSGTSAEATMQQDEPKHGGSAGFSNPEIASQSVWYSLVVPADRWVVIEATTQSEFLLPLLTVFTGSEAHIARRVAASVSYPLVVKLIGGVEYRIAVLMHADLHPGLGPAPGETFELRITRFENEELRPGNDDFVNAVELKGEELPLIVSGSNNGATQEIGEPFPNNELSAVGRSVWYRWMAPHAGGIQVVVNGQDGIFPATAVFTGETLVSLEQVSSSSAPGLFYATKGVLYHIVISSEFAAPPGEFSFMLKADDRSFSRWKTENFTVEQVASGQSEPHQDPDLDLRSNVIEYALGSDPNSQDFGDVVSTSFVAGEFSTQVNLPARMPDLDYSIEMSENGRQWIEVSKLEDWFVQFLFGKWRSSSARRTVLARFRVNLKSAP